jgi:transposase
MQKRERFTSKQTNELQDLINQKESSKSEALRAQAVLLINAKANQEQIKMLTGLDGKYAYKLRKKYLEKGLNALIDKRKPKQRALLTRGQRTQVAKVLKEATPREFGFKEDFWSTAMLGWIIKEQYGVQYKSKTPLYLLFKEAKFTYHKPDRKYHKRNQADVDNWQVTMEPIIQSAYAD